MVLGGLGWAGPSWHEYGSLVFASRHHQLTPFDIQKHRFWTAGAHRQLLYTTLHIPAPSWVKKPLPSQGIAGPATSAGDILPHNHRRAT